MVNRAIAARRYVTIGALVIALALVGGACGSSSKTATGSAGGSSTTKGAVKHTKAKFVLHAGLAFGAFHRWIYKPAKAGQLRHPLQHKVTVVKAALAAGFVYHELRLALAAAKADPTLSKLVAPVAALGDKIKGLPAAIKGGQANEGSVASLNNSISSIKSQSASAGHPITEQTPATPSG